MPFRRRARRAFLLGYEDACVLKESDMRRFTAATLVLMVCLLAWPAVGVLGGTSTSAAVNKATAYLQTQQQNDGSYTEFDGPINATCGAGLAIAAAGLDVNTWKKSGLSGIDFLLAQKDSLSNAADADTNSAKIAQLVMLLVASNNDPRAFAGVDWVAILTGTQNATTGAYGTAFIRHPWIIMALHSAGETIPANALDYLLANQEANGGFGVNGLGSGSDTNTTAICLEALAAAGVVTSSTTVQQALAYLHTQQNSDGGFPWAKPSLWGTDSDSSSTSWVIQALIAAGEDQTGPAWTISGNTPVTFLLGMQNASGAFGYQTSWADDNLMCTYQAIPALMGKVFPLGYAEPVKSSPDSVTAPAETSTQTLVQGQDYLPYTGR